MPGKAVLTIHPPIPIGDYQVEALPELMARTRNVIQSAL